MRTTLVKLVAVVTLFAFNLGPISSSPVVAGDIHMGYCDWCMDYYGTPYRCCVLGGSLCNWIGDCQ